MDQNATQTKSQVLAVFLLVYSLFPTLCVLLSVLPSHRSMQVGSSVVWRRWLALLILGKVSSTGSKTSGMDAFQ